MKMWTQRMRKIVLSLFLVTGIVEHSEQCLSKSAITEGVDETHVHTEPHVFRREREPLQPIALRSVHRSLFRPPQHLLYGFTPVTTGKRENVKSFIKKDSYQSNAEPKQDNIELVNIPGPPYNHQAVDQLHPQNTVDQTVSLLQAGQKIYQMESQKIIYGEQDDSKNQRIIALPAISYKRNINYSAEFQHLKPPHGSGNNPLKQYRESPRRNPSRPDPFKT